MYGLYSSILTLSAFLIVVKVIFIWVKQIYTLFACKLPSPGVPLPILGHSYHFLGVSPEETLEVITNLVKKDSLCKKYLAFLGPYEMFIVYHPETVEAVFSSTKDLIAKSWHYKYLETWLNKGLLTSTGSKWQTRRKLLTPSFHFNILGDALATFNTQSNVLCEILLDDFIENNASKRAIDIFPYIQRSALDMILETAMGVELGVQHSRESNYSNSIQRIVHIFQLRQILPWYQNDILFRLTELGKEHESHLKVLHGYSKSVIEARREELEMNTELETKQDGIEDLIPERKKKIAFLDLLLQMRLSDGSALSNSDIQEEVDTFMFEGHDTTTNSLAWTIFLIGLYPQIQEKLYDEQKKIFGDFGKHEDVQKHHLTEMKFLECCIKESLRLYPPVPIIGRTAEAKTMIDGYSLEKGESIVVFVQYLHRNPIIWDNPHEFIPERFMEGRKKMHPFAYVPFSAGARNCIGQKFALMEEKTVLSKIIRAFQIESVDSIDQVKPVIEIITRPKDGIRVKLQQRFEN